MVDAPVYNPFATSKILSTWLVFRAGLRRNHLTRRGCHWVGCPSRSIPSRRLERNDRGHRPPAGKSLISSDGFCLVLMIFKPLYHSTSYEEVLFKSMRLVLCRSSSSSSSSGSGSSSDSDSSSSSSDSDDEKDKAKKGTILFYRLVFWFEHSSDPSSDRPP